MDALDKSYARSNAFINSVEEQMKNVVAGDISRAIIADDMSGLWATSRHQGSNRRRYALFRGWLYAAVNALAHESASQNVHIGRFMGSAPNPSMERRRRPSTVKHAELELEIIPDHPLLESINEPNPVQRRWQFVYNFVANLNLTGWSYVVAGESEEGRIEFYSLPTTWVTPVHKEYPMSHFKIQNPDNPSATIDNKELLDRTQVGFAYLPDPSDPLSAMPPAQSQSLAIRIDDHIQTSQEKFFNNGVFPSVIVSIGKDPHPEVPGGIRPRLTGPQRRQVMGAVRKVMAGVANYGNPAIVDGMIDKIERLSATQNEMGWDKSEMAVRTRILSSFGVHPYILGEPMNIGGYAQAYMIERRFCKRVNAFLAMLSEMMTGFLGPMTNEDERTVIWWDECEPLDPSLKWQNLREARRMGDISRNEFRAELGLPPDDTGGNRNHQYTAGDINSIVQVQREVSKGDITPEQAIQIYMTAFDMAKEEAEEIAGEAPKEPVQQMIPPQFLPQPVEDEEEEEMQEMNEAARALRAAVSFLESDPKQLADQIVEASQVGSPCSDTEELNR